MASNGLRDPALPRAQWNALLSCQHVPPHACKPLQRDLWAEMEVEMEKCWACSNMACCTPPWKLLWKGAGCSQGSSLVYDPFCFLQQSGSHYTYTTGKVEVGFGGVLVVCFDFFGGFLGFFGGYFRLFGFCGGWVFFYLEGFLLVWGGICGSSICWQFHGFCHLLSTYFFVLPFAFETLHPALIFFTFWVLKSGH